MEQISFYNRQLAKLLSGNEVRSKVAIAAIHVYMQKAVNFTLWLSTWSRKVSWAPFYPDSEKFLTPPIYPQIFCEFMTQVFSGKKAVLFDRKLQCMAREAVDGVASFVAIACLILWASFLLSRKSSVSKILMQQRRRGHACAVLPV